MALPVLKGNTSTKEAQLLVILKIINLCILYLCWWWVLDAPVGPRDGGALIQTHTGAAGGGWTRVEDAGWSADALGEGWRTGCSGCRDDAGWSADALGEGWRTGCSGCRDDAGWSTGSVDVRWRTGCRDDAGWSTGSVDVRWRTGCRDDAGWSAGSVDVRWRMGCSGCRDDAGWSAGSVDVRWRTRGLEVRCFGFWWLRQQQENLLQCSCIICLDFTDINRAEEHTHT